MSSLASNVVAYPVELAVSATGLVRIRTAVLITVEETDDVLGIGVRYRGPGT